MPQGSTAARDTVWLRGRALPRRGALCGSGCLVKAQEVPRGLSARLYPGLYLVSDTRRCDLRTLAGVTYKSTIELASQSRGVNVIPAPSAGALQPRTMERESDFAPNAAQLSGETCVQGCERGSCVAAQPHPRSGGDPPVW